MTEPLTKWLNIASRYCRLYLDHELEKLGLNSSQHMYICSICQNPGITQDYLYTNFHIHPSNITRSLNCLEKNGFIQRQPNEQDKRTCCLFPTQKALDTNQQIKNIVKKWEKDMLKDLSAEDQQLFCRLMKKIGQRSVDEVQKFCS